MSLPTYKLVTVNKVPARAKILIGRVVEDVKDVYTIDYVANAERESLFDFSFSWLGREHQQDWKKYADCWSARRHRGRKGHV